MGFLQVAVWERRVIKQGNLLILEGCKVEMNPSVDILVAEDDPLIREYITKILETACYRVLSASSGPEALEVLDTGFRPELLFTDVVMRGGMTGVQLAERVRHLLPGIKILFTSGYTTMLEREQLPAGAQMLTKPFRRKDCLEAVRHIIVRQ